MEKATFDNDTTPDYLRNLDEQPTSETLPQKDIASTEQDASPDYLKSLNADTILNDEIDLDEGALDKLTFATKEVTKAYLKGSASLARGVGGLITFAGDNLRVPKDVLDYSKDFGYGVGANMQVKDKFGATLSTIGTGISDFFKYGEEADIIQPDQEIAKGSFLDNPSWTRALSIVSGSLPNMAAGGFVGMASKPILGIAFMTGLESEDVYRDAKAVGKSQFDADLLFGATAAGVGTLEVLMSPIGKNIGASVDGFKQYIVNGITGGFKEGATEGFQQIHENIVRKIGLDKTRSLLDGVVESIIGGVGSGGAVSFLSTNTKSNVENIVKENNVSPDEVSALVDETAKSITQNRTEIDAKVEQNVGKTNAILNDVANKPEQAASLVQKTVNKQLVDAGVDVEQAEATSRLYEARSLAASRALGVSPMDWYAGLRLSFQNESMAQVPETALPEIPFTQKRAKTTKGQIAFKDTETILKLFKDADASTLVHETGHLFLRDMRDISSVTDKQDVKEDFNHIKNWLDSKDGYFTRKQEETFARGFEQYLREGKAPTSRLKSVFDKFKSWLTSIYKSASDLNVDINDDIRRVFGRMLGAEMQEITELNQIAQDQADYAKNREIAKSNSSLKIKASNAFDDIKESANDWTSKAFAPITTRLGMINPSLKDAVRKFMFNVEKSRYESKREIAPFLKSVSNKMSPDDYMDFDLALKNIDTDKVDAMVKKYGVEKEYKKVRDMIDETRQRAIDAGLDVGFIEDYFPRVVTDYEGLITELKKTDDWTFIEREMRKQDPEQSWNPEQQAEFANMFIRGYRGGDKINPKRASFTKERKIDLITPEMNQYYADSLQALIQYTDRMNYSIESFNFLGKGGQDDVANRKETAKKISIQDNIIKSLNNKLSDYEAKLEEAETKTLKTRYTNLIKKTKEEIDQRNASRDNMASDFYMKDASVQERLDKSIGGYVANLVESGGINRSQEQELTSMIKSLLGQRGTHGIINTLKNMGYVYTMGSPISALTQLSDYAFSIYNFGFYETGKALSKSIKKEGLTREDLYLDDIVEEFTDTSIASKAVNKVFQAVGLKFMDNMSKDTFINASYSELKKLADNETPEFKQQLENIFGDESAQTIKDIKDGVLSENVKYLMFSELSDFQPLTLAEMPEYYLNGGNLRVLYMLKSYTIKQFDIYRRECIVKMKSDDKATRIEGMRNMVKLSMSLALMGAGTDMLKDLILMRKINLSDVMTDNMIKLMGLSKYQIYSIKQDGLADALYQAVIVPPLFAPINDISRDLWKSISGKEDVDFKDLRIWNSIPLVGKLYYWWAGGGYEKEKKKRQKDNG